MKNYELSYLISPDLSEQDLRNLSEKIKNFVQEEAGTPGKTTEPSEKNLGYSIKKKESSFLVTLNLSLNPDKLGNLEKKLKAENQILRYIILTKKVTRERPERIFRSRRTATKEGLPGVKKPFGVTKKITEPKKVELKEIDKKIEEILGE